MDTPRDPMSAADVARLARIQLTSEELIVLGTFVNPFVERGFSVPRRDTL